MASPTAAEKVRRYHDLKAKRSNYDNDAQDIADFCLPHRQKIVTDRSPGPGDTRDILDITAQHSMHLLSGSMAGSVTSPALEWFHLKLREEALNQVREIKDWLHGAEQEMYLAYRQSNFHEEVHQFYLDLIAFGTAAMFVEERARTDRGFGGFHFKALAWGEYVIDEGPDGRVDTLYRCYKMTAKAIVQQWGEDKAGEAVVKKAETKPDEQFEVLHCVAPRTLYSKSKGRYDALNKPWESVYILLDGQGQSTGNGHRVLAKGGYDEFPYMVARWAKASGEMYGEGPAQVALPAIRTLNAERALMLRAAGKMIDPPLEVPHDGVVGQVNIEPGGLNAVQIEPGQGKPSIMPLQAGGDVRWADYAIADERRQIEFAFFVEQLQLPEKGNMTATEVERHYERMRRILGAILSRLESEFLNPLIDRCFNLMFRAGSFGDPPQVATDGSEGEWLNIDVEYEGPLARSQRSARFWAATEVLQFVGQFYAMDPALGQRAADNLDIDTMIRDAAEVRGLPANYLTALDKMHQDRQKRQAMMAQQQQMNMIEQGATAAGRAAPALTALQDAAGMMNGGSQTARAA